MTYLLKMPSWADYQSKNGISVDFTKLNKVTSYDVSSNVLDSTIKLPDNLNQGYYMAEIDVGSQKVYTNVQINNTVALVNCYGSNANIWVNDGKTNTPVSNSTILYNDKEIRKDR